MWGFRARVYGALVASERQLEACAATYVQRTWREHRKQMRVRLVHTEALNALRQRRRWNAFVARVRLRRRSQFPSTGEQQQGRWSPSSPSPLPGTIRHSRCLQGHGRPATAGAVPVASLGRRSGTATTAERARIFLGPRGARASGPASFWENSGFLSAQVKVARVQTATKLEAMRLVRRQQTLRRWRRTGLSCRPIAATAG